MRKVLLAILSILFTKDVSIGLCQAIWYLFICFSSLVQFNFPFCLPTYFFVDRYYRKVAVQLWQNWCLPITFPAVPFCLQKSRAALTMKTIEVPKNKGSFADNWSRFEKERGAKSLAFVSATTIGSELLELWFLLWLVYYSTEMYHLSYVLA